MLLELKQVSIAYGSKQIVRDVSLSAEQGEIIGIVGESGSGKTTLLRGIIGLLGRGGAVTEGQILFRGKDLVGYTAAELRQLRGQDVAMIFQHADLSLDPLWTIGDSFYESLHVHNRSVSRRQALELAAQRLEALSLRDPEIILRRYPHELSGGMCQRAAIAVSMANHPALLLADEPTSALDVTVQAQVIETMMNLRDTLGTTILIVTHNMGVVNRMADRVGVMYHGELVEWGRKEQVLHHPTHAYTRRLLAAVPKMDGTLPQVDGGAVDG